MVSDHLDRAAGQEYDRDLGLLRVPERYALEREIGRGGMATVYLARDLKHERLVAIKVLRPAVAADIGIERFLREIRVAAQLHHPHILPLYDSGTTGADPGTGGPCPFYVMPYLEGESLRGRLARQGQLSLEDALLLAREVADALDCAHRRNIVHRDIKPENILLEEGHAVVADFGIARAITAAGEADLTAIGASVGTPAYMSPEQAAGERDLDGRSDIYSLACVLFEMLAGRPPFVGSSAQAIMVQRFTTDPVRVRAHRAEVPPAIDDVINQALAREPAARFATAAQFADVLHLADTVGPSTPPTRSTPLRSSAADIPSIAVLPFVNLSSEKENEYFSDGMTDEIINALTQVPALRVAARTSTFAFKGKNVDVREIGERLKVRTLLEGSVRKAGDRIRISAQLVNAADGYHLWSQTYERTLEDVFAVQDELARAIAGALTRAVVGTRSVLVKPPTENLEAYTLYLRGRFYFNQLTIDGLHTAIGYYEQAVTRDSGYAQGHAGLAGCWALLGFEEFGDLAPNEAMPRARAAALRALESDPLLPDAHQWLGTIAMLYDWDWAAAEARFGRALELAPGHARIHHWYALFLGITGRHEESIQLVRRAEELDPISLTIHLSVARCYAYAGRHDEAMDQLRLTLQMEPSLGLGYLWLGRVLTAQGKFREALAEVEKGMQLVGRSPNMLTSAGYAQARLGARHEALQAIEELHREATQRYVSPLCEANIRAGLGELDEAFRLYEIAFQQHSGYLAFTRVDPFRSHPLRSDARFAALLKRLHLDS